LLVALLLSEFENGIKQVRFEFLKSKIARELYLLEAITMCLWFATIGFTYYMSKRGFRKL